MKEKRKKQLTKVTKQLVKCSRCGNESEQLIVYSVNFLLGSKEDNQKLIEHKQKCPFCGYEHIDISIKESNIK